MFIEREIGAAGFGCLVVLIAVYLSVAGCGISTPPEAILAGASTITPAALGAFGAWDYDATFNRNGGLVELSEESLEGAMVELEIDNATSQVSGNAVIITIPNAAGMRVFNGTLSADQNTLTGFLMQEIDLGGLEASLPGGELTLERVAS